MANNPGTGKASRGTRSMKAHKIKGSRPFVHSDLKNDTYRH